MAKTNTELLERIDDADEPSSGPTLKQMLATQQSEIARALPKSMDADTFTRIALTTMKTSDVLAECNPRTYISCLMLCAQLGFEPGPLGRVYFVPRKVKVNANGREFWDNQVTFQIGYQGWIELARRSKEIRRVECRAVYPGDEFSFEYGSNQHLRHVPNGEPVGLLGVEVQYQGKGQNKTRTVVKGDESAIDPTKVYAYVKFENGEEAFHVMAYSDALAYRRFAKTKKVWDQHPLPMALKTVFLRLKTWLPATIEMDRAAAHDDTTPPSLSNNMLEQPRPAEPDVADAEATVIDSEPDDSEPPQDSTVSPQDALTQMRQTLNDQKLESFTDYLSSKGYPESSSDMTDKQAAEAAQWIEGNRDQAPDE